MACASTRPASDYAAPNPPSAAPSSEIDAGVAEGDAGLGEPDASVLKTDSLELPPAPDDPLAAMYSKRLDFRGGAPLVPVRLMEGGASVTFSPRGRMRMRISGPVEKTVEAPGGSTWTVRMINGRPAIVTSRILLGEFQLSDVAGIEAEQKVWEDRGLVVRTQVLGSVYGIAGKVLDNRKHLLLLDEVLTGLAAAKRQSELLRRFAARTTLFETLEKKPTGILELLDDSHNSVALGENRIIAESLDESGFDVREVEYGVGYDFHNFEDRSYRGALELTVDRNGTLAVVNLVTLEDLLKGLVPSEIFAKAPAEALKAQAVTARGEVLAKIGTKHLGDPYLLCSEQHCAVYKGLSGEAASTTQAVEATRGEGLFSSNGRLVDSVYSAVCGGHTEDNDAVWGGIPNPNLRGRPDFIGPRKGWPVLKDLKAFLNTELPSACRLASLAQPTKYRWDKHFTLEEMDRLVEPLHIGSVQAIAVVERGVSGRARLLSLSGDAGATQIRGELNIRRQFGMLNSSMFLVAPEHDDDGHLTGWLFHGGGWGHGVGMCQTGAIGRAEAGQRYQTILRYYFSGAEVAPIY